MRNIPFVLLSLTCLLASCNPHPIESPALTSVIIEAVDETYLYLPQEDDNGNDPNEMLAESNGQFRISIPAGVPLSDEERLVFSKGLVNAINYVNYFYGEHSEYWALNGFGRTVVEVYERLADSRWGRYFCFILSSLDKHPLWSIEEEVLAVWLGFETICGTFDQEPHFHHWFKRMDDAIEFLAEGKALEGNYQYLGSINIEVPDVYPPKENMHYFNRADELVVDFKRMGVRPCSLYIGAMEHFCEILSDSYKKGPPYYKGDISTTVITVICAEVDEKLYYVRALCGYTDDPDDPLDRILYYDIPGPLLYREPENAKEAFLLEQIVKLGNKHEITE